MRPLFLLMLTGAFCFSAIAFSTVSFAGTEKGELTWYLCKSDLEAYGFLTTTAAQHQTLGRQCDFRVQSSLDNLEAALKTGVIVEIKYDGKRVAPTTDSIRSLNQEIALYPTNSAPRGRAQIFVTHQVSDSMGLFLASARLSYLDRALFDIGFESNQTMIEVPAEANLHEAIVDFKP